MPCPLVPCASGAILTGLSNASPSKLGTTPTTHFVPALTSFSQCKTHGPSAAIGRESVDATILPTIDAISAPGAQPPLTELSHALELRKLRAISPYKPDVWEAKLIQAGLIDRYLHVPDGLRRGFILDIPNISITQAPPNKESINTYQQQFLSIIQSEVKKGRYLGPFQANEVYDLIGHFQTSPFSIIPKPGRPGSYRVIQNYSFPHNTSKKFPNQSINSYINPDNFPSTWGTFHVLALTISRLPPGSQLATRDVSEAYRTIPLHHSQWPGSVVRVSDSLFCIDTCTCFGLRPSAGAYGVVVDAGLDLFRFSGIGPASRWVDDHLFIRILRIHLEEYNRQRQERHLRVIGQGQHQDGGRIWFGGEIFEDGTIDELDEDSRFPIRDLSASSPRSEEESLFTCNFADIDVTSNELGIPWQLAKDAPFAYSNPYIRFIWDIARNVVYLDQPKKDKYLLAIKSWRAHRIHVLQDVQQLYGKLLHTTLVIPRGRAYLTSLEAMLSNGSSKPFLPRSPLKTLPADLDWWVNILQSPFVGRIIPSPISHLHDPKAYSDASSGIGIAIVIGSRWRAWHLRTGWQMLDGKKDIGWAEAVGFELLTQYLIQLGGPERHLHVFGDNKGVVEGWRNGRSRNSAVNAVFRRIFAFIYDQPTPYTIYPAYVSSASNPADDPSRAIYASTELLLPAFPIPIELDQFIIDPFVNDSRSKRFRDRCESSYVAPSSVVDDSDFSHENPDSTIVPDHLYHVNERQWRN